MKRALLLVPAFLLVLALTGEEKPEKDYDYLDSREFFIEGTMAFHMGQYNRALQLFEKSLNKKPENLLTRYWLAWAYYYGGMEDTAVHEWKKVYDRIQNPDPLLEKALREKDASEALVKELERQRAFRLENKLPVDVPLLQTLAEAQRAYNKTLATIEALRPPIGEDTLGSWLEVLENRRSLNPEILPRERYLPLYEFDGRPQDPNRRVIFQRPTSIRPTEDGGYVLASFGTEDVLEVTAAGRVNRRLLGTWGGFRGPFDAVPLGLERYMVSEFTGDRLSLVNNWGFTERTIGKKGKGDGELLGPQYLAMDPDGNVYVSEWGNRRVSKFSADGTFLLNFGQRETLVRDPENPGEFSGFQGPSGLAIVPRKGSEGPAYRIFVADKASGQLFSFDPNGNYLETHARGLLKEPEGLWTLPDGRILVCDRLAESQGPKPGQSKVYFYNPEGDQLEPFDQEWDQGFRIPFASFDTNGQLLVADYDAQKIRVYTPGSTVLGGISVRPVRVALDKYPEVFVEAFVEDIRGKPVLGLMTGNFSLRETLTPIDNFKIDVNPTSLKDLDLSLVVDRSEEMNDPGMKGLLGEVVQGLASLRSTKGGLWLFAAGDEPQLLNKKTNGVLETVTLAQDPGNISPAPKVDLALRMAGNQLIPGFKKRAVVFITPGSVGEKAFARYQAQDMARFFQTNGLVFEVVQLREGPLAEELDFLVKSTGGSVYTPKDDMTKLLTDLQSQIAGPYVFSYKSITPSEGGQRYIPIEIEVQFHKKSGRGLTGFFAPNDLIPPKGGFPPPPEKPSGGHGAAAPAGGGGGGH